MERLELASVEFYAAAPDGSAQNFFLSAFPSEHHRPYRSNIQQLQGHTLSR
jgi:hypothetical protein